MDRFAMTDPLLLGRDMVEITVRNELDDAIAGTLGAHGHIDVGGVYTFRYGDTCYQLTIQDEIEPRVYCAQLRRCSDDTARDEAPSS